MASNNTDLLSLKLEKLNVIRGLIGTALINRNGLTTISHLPRDVDDRKLGAMAATLLGAMEAAASTLNESISSLTVEFEDCQLVVFIINNDIILVTLLENDIDLGLVLIEIEDFIMNLQL